MGFAKALRAILRQDPDVLMIGEIRDPETANIAIQASLTGHLVLSTMHTNSANEALSRLLDLGQEPYLLASAVKAIVAQRLLRKLCKHCATEHLLSDDQASQLGHAALAGQKILVAGQCEHCDQSGYSGRVAVFEMIVLDKNGQNQLHNFHQNNGVDSDAQLTFETVQKRSLHSHCIDRLLAGETSFEEILRVYNINSGGKNRD